MAGFLGTALAILGMMGGSALLTVVGGVLGGLLAGPFLSGMIDTVLRALRDEAGLLVAHHKRAWKQNWKQSLLPGALFGPVCGQLELDAPRTGAGRQHQHRAVGGLAGRDLCLHRLFQLAAGAGAAGGSAAAPACQKRRTDVLRLLPRTLAAALVLAVYWGLTLLYLPATILVIVVFGFWLPVTVAGMILYPGLDKVFRLEETLAARRDAEIEERMEQNRPNFDH